MFKQTATDLTKATPDIVAQWLATFDTVLTDCDGVQWHGNELIEGSRDAINRLQELGKTVYFVTNNPFKTREDLSRSAEKQGYYIPPECIISPAYIVAKYLRDQNFTKKVYLLGSIGISNELDALGIQYIDSDSEIGGDDEINRIEKFIGLISNGVQLNPEVGAVVVSCDLNFSFSKLVKASNYLRDPNCLFIATSPDTLYPTTNGTIIPALEPLVSAVEMTSGRKATVFGKPNALMCKALIEEGRIDPQRTLMIGDTAKCDMVFGINCGFQTLFVGTGVNNMGEVHEWQTNDDKTDDIFIPDVYLPKLGDLLPFLN